jgi:hypothetical protein
VILLVRVKVESRARRGKSWRRVPEALCMTAVNMFGKKEFGVKYETEVMDMRIPRDGSVLEAEWCWGNWTASSE